MKPLTYPVPDPKPLRYVLEEADYSGFVYDSHAPITHRYSIWKNGKIVGYSPNYHEALEQFRAESTIG